MKRNLILPWAVVAAAFALHGVAVSAVVQRTLSFRAGVDAAPPPVLQLFNGVTHRLGPGADFFAVYHAGVQASRGQDLYSGEPDGRTPYFYPFRYLPAFAHLPGRALAALPPWTAYLVWLLLLEVLLIAIGVAILRRMPRRLVPWSAALLLGSTPFWLELHMGQFSFLTGVLICAAALALRDGRVGLAQAGWAAAVFVKIFPLVILPVWLRIRTLGPALLVVGAVLALSVPFFIASPELWQQFYRLNLGTHGFTPANTGNFGLLHLFGQGLVLGLEAPRPVWLIASRILQVLVLSLAVLAVLRWGRERPALAVVLMTLAHQLSYYHVWEHHYSMIVPLVLVAALDLGPRHQILVLGLLAVVALPTPFVFWDIPGPNDPGPQWSLARQMTLPALKALPTLVIALVATHGMRLAHLQAAEQPAHGREGDVPL
jgi:hypothetical protein